jgi:predicted MFS family arabinose efflux permease
MNPRTLPSTRRKLFDLKAIMEPAYLLFCLGLFAVWTGMYLPFFYIPLYARRVLHVSEDLASYMLAFMGAGSVFGRIITNVLADKIGAIQSFLPVTFILGSLAFVWIGIKNTAGTIVFCVLYGFFSGASISLTPVMLTAVSPDLSVVGTRMGMAFSFASFGLLIGSPIGGVLIGTEAGYTAVQVFSGATILIGLVLHSVSGLLTTRKGHLRT